jgi:hypothetical protein
MKSFITILLLAFIFSGHTSHDSYVYICKGPKSTKYHYTKTCRGLTNCSTDIYKVTMAEAKKLNRGLCGWED